MAKSVLLVEDDELLSELLTAVIELEGYRVAWACDGLEGLDRLAAEKFDLVILDLLMPRMDGLRFLRTLPDRISPPPPVFVLSASVTDTVVDQIRFPYVVAVIRKPVQPAQLVAQVAALIGPARDR